MFHSGACLRGRTATQRSKKGSEKVLGRVLEKGSQKGSEKAVFFCGFTIERGSEHQEWPRQTKPKKGQFMNFSHGHSGTKVRYVNRACFLGKNTRIHKIMGEVHMNFSFGPFFLLVFRKAPDTFNFLRHVMRAIWSVRPKCSHRCVSLTETSLKPVQTLKHTTKNSAEQTAMRMKRFKHIAI